MGMSMNPRPRFASLLAAALCVSQAVADPKPETKRGFEKYAAAVEARVREDRSTAHFLRVAANPEVRARLRAGEIPTESAKSLGVEPSVPVPSAQVQHWIGAAFVPHSTIAEALPRLKDYSNRKHYMTPEIIDSRTLNQKGDEFQVYLRLSETGVISGFFDLNLRINYWMSGHDLAIDSRSERIVEVSAAEAQEGSSIADRGLLWALNHYWRMTEGDSGVYLECEALVLSRRPPGAVEWIADPLIARAARRTLINTLRATMRIVSG